MYRFTVITALGALLPSLSLVAAQFNGRGTWFEVGLGACGEYNTDSDFIVALSPDLYNNGQYCDQGVLVEANGNTVYATVRDECPGCGTYDLDMSPGLFEQFASLDTGVVWVNWNFA